MASLSAVLAADSFLLRDQYSEAGFNTGRLPGDLLKLSYDTWLAICFQLNRHLNHVVDPVFNEVGKNDIRLIAWGKRISRP